MIRPSGMTKVIGMAASVGAGVCVTGTSALPVLTGNAPGVNLFASTLPPSVLIVVGGMGATVMLGGMIVMGGGVGVSVGSAAPHDARRTLMPSGAIKRNGE